MSVEEQRQKEEEEKKETAKHLALVAEAVFLLWVLGALFHYYQQMGFGAYIMDLIR